MPQMNMLNRKFQHIILAGNMCVCERHIHYENFPHSFAIKIMCVYLPHIFIIILTQHELSALKILLRMSEREKINLNFAEGFSPILKFTNTN